MSVPEPYTFWRFAGDHPVALVLAIFVILMFVHDISLQWASRRKS